MARKRFTVTLDDGEEIGRALRQMGIDVEQVLEAAVQAGARVIASGADQLAPAPQIATETASVKKGRVEVDIGPPREKWYWKFFETGATQHEIPGSPLLAFEAYGENIVIGGAGHPGMAAKPFLRPAFDSKQDGAKQALGNRLREVIE